MGLGRMREHLIRPGHIGRTFTTRKQSGHPAITIPRIPSRPMRSMTYPLGAEKSSARTSTRLQTFLSEVGQSAQFSLCTLGSPWLCIPTQLIQREQVLRVCIAMGNPECRERIGLTV